ncbi:MAG: S-layer homology domain-containing protein, partial [Pseudoflavonifractor sp.]
AGVMSALSGLYETYTKASGADVAAAKKAYEDKKAALETASNTGYANSEELWDNAATIAVYVPVASPFKGDQDAKNQIKVSDLDYETDGVVTVTMSDQKPLLSSQAQAQLIRDNHTRDILVESPTLWVRIPVGTLSDGDDLSAMLMQSVVLPEDASDYVVRYIDRDGVTHLVPFSLVTPQKVTYIASAPGSYGLIKNPKRFSDIPDGFWGTQQIRFVTQRGLFHGLTEDCFGYADKMTRGMFVTVLGRLAGIDPAAYSKRSFSDVDPDSWYGGYVAWASQNNIVGGVGAGRFDPDAPVTREQMCAMLVRYLEWAKIALPTEVSDRKFTDQSEISTWAEAAVKLLCSVGIVKGTELGELQPGADASRAEVAAIYAQLIAVILGA